MVVSDGQSLRLVFLEFSRAHRVVAKHEAMQVSKLVEVVKAYLMRKARALVDAAQGRAILYTYASDGTPMLTKSTFSHSLGGQRRFVRKAGRATDFLVERATLVTTGADGQRRVAVLLRDPRPLSEGKTAWHEFGAFKDFFPMLRTLKHRGIIVAHACFDRALQASLCRKIQQRQGLYYEVVGGGRA